MFIEHIMTFDQARKIEEDGDKNLVCKLYLNRFSCDEGTFFMAY